MKNRITSAGTNVGSEPKAEVTTSSPNNGNTNVVRRHLLEYSMYSCKVSWCTICNNHFYNDRNKEHTTVATSDHYHEL